MTCFDAKQRIRAHKMCRHRDISAVGEQKIRFISELFNAREDVIPATAVQPRGMVAQLVENFVHLKGCGNRLDQHCRADGAVRHTEFFLRQLECIIPNTRLEMAFHLRQVEIRAAAARD